MHRQKVTRVKGKSKCNKCKCCKDGARTRFSEAKIETKDKKKFPGQGQNFQGQVHSPERSRSQILQLLVGVWYIFKNLGTGLELECSLSTFTVQISIFAQFFHLLQLICFVLKSVGVECCPKV